MAKYPQLGRVKTRLAREVGWVRATAFHRHAVDRLARRLSATGRWRVYLAVTPDRHIFDAFPGLGFLPRVAQGPGDLGARMDRLMRVMPPGPVIIVGTDIPDMRAVDIAEAFQHLGGKAAVFGPAEDGGYWLVGLPRSPRIPEIFRHVRWSSPHALTDTLGNIALGDAAFARTLSDVDDAASHRRLSDTGARLVPPRRRWRPA